LPKNILERACFAVSAILAFVLRIVQGFGTHFINIFTAIIRCLAISGWVPFVLRFTNIDERLKKVLFVIISFPVFLMALVLLYYYDQTPKNNPVLEGEKAELKVAHFIIASVAYFAVMWLIFFVRRLILRRQGEEDAE
jgi:ABC-type dipeptide/oligopeptide/nickel transport system permease subunit